MCQDLGLTCIFGYGSLMWRPGFQYERCFAGYVKGYLRRFWLKCTHHRGNAKQPGRVVTLLPSECKEDKVWGVCYLVRDDLAASVIEGLDVRECGYERKNVPVYITAGDMEVEARATSILYVGNTCEEHFVGPSKTLEEDAKIIATAVGKSGPNKDYLFKLATSLRSIGVYDDHVHTLEELVQQFLATQASSCESFVKESTLFIREEQILEYDPYQKKQLLAAVSDEVIKGTIIVDSGAVQAVSNLGKGLLPCGIKEVKGEFGPNCFVQLCSPAGKVVAKAITKFSSEQIGKIKGKHSSSVHKILCSTLPVNVIEQENMILV